MFLELWSVAVLLLSDFLELIIERGGSSSPVPVTVNIVEAPGSLFSIPFLCFVLFLISLSILAWRSTYIPELPPVPRPPYVIQISSAPTLNNNGERNSLADVRLLSSGVEVDNLRRSFPTLLVRERGGGVLSRGGGITTTAAAGLRLSSRGISINSVGPSNQSPGGEATSNLSGSIGPDQSQSRTTLRFHQVRQQHQRPTSTSTTASNEGSALLQGLLRPGSVIRPLLQRASYGGNQVQNLIVYHRVNVYHHHHHHHHSENGSQRPSVGLPLPPQLSTSLPQNNSSPVETQPTPLPDSSNLSSSSVVVPEQDNTARSSRSHSVDSSTQYEYVDVDSVVEDSSETYEQLIENSGSVNVLLNMNSNSDSGSATHEIDVNSGSGRVAATGEEEDNQTEVEGVRLRRNVAFSDIRSGDSAEGLPESNTTTNAMDKSETVGGIPEPPSAVSTHGEINDIRFTIKFLNDTQMDVTTLLGEKIVDFKRRHFATELSENKSVRLIFNGRVLDNDTSTLRESGVFDQCVVHCLIVSRPPPPSTGGTSSSSTSRSSGRANGGILRGGTPEPGIFFVGFVGVFLIFLWFICFHFGQHLFTQSAVVSLTVLTAIFLIGLVAFYLPVHPANPA